MEKTINKKYVYNGKIINVRCDDALAENGNPCLREVVEHRGGAAILAIEGEYVYLVRQYRYAYGEYLLEIPAGKLEKGEDPYFTAIRELEEEIGKKADSLQEFGKIYPTPGYCNEIIHLYLATEFISTATHFDDDESLSIEKVKLKDAVQMVINGDIKDAKTAIALLKYNAIIEMK
ncbi:MAG: NUDIX hydrolase [Christensenellales bacterium]